MVISLLAIAFPVNARPGISVWQSTYCQFPTLETTEGLAEAGGLLGVSGTVTKLRFLYRVNPFGPPQAMLELPAHAILQRPSVAGVEPAPRVLPQ